MVQCGGFCPYSKIAIPLSLTRIYEVPVRLSPFLGGMKRIDFFPYAEREALRCPKVPRH